MNEPQTVQFTSLLDLYQDKLFFIFVSSHFLIWYVFLIKIRWKLLPGVSWLRQNHHQRAGFKLFVICVFDTPFLTHYNFYFLLFQRINSVNFVNRKCTSIGINAFLKKQPCHHYSTWYLLTFLFFVPTRFWLLLMAILTKQKQPGSRLSSWLGGIGQKDCADIGLAIERVTAS